MVSGDVSLRESDKNFTTSMLTGHVNEKMENKRKSR